MSKPYVPPKVWQWEQKDDNRFAGINRPTAGARFEKELPVGKHPIQLYSLGTPNGQKVTILLEELLERGIAGAEYDAWYIDINAGDQFGSGFVAINPNSKIPALVDQGVKPAIPVFESGAILLYLAEKFSAFLSAEARARARCLSWLFWQVGATPYVGGGFGHFYAYANEKQQYPIDRFTLETKRQLDLLDKHFAENEYVMGEEYTIADMAIWPWYGGLVAGRAYGAAEFLDGGSYTHLLRWDAQLGQRPAVRRGRLVNRGEGGLRERHSAADFEGLA
ncbi:MAG TPA: glutathione-dependent disulfide-bond oxidoreductase [Candidatus Desulfobacillus sp.]|nr:glutathione-dependent disulfide-bond oxidoreductase [Candidatus Desulfobacillus sp.]